MKRQVAENAKKKRKLGVAFLAVKNENVLKQANLCNLNVS
jgi:hypothetical protein